MLPHTGRYCKVLLLFMGKREQGRGNEMIKLKTENIYRFNVNSKQEKKSTVFDNFTIAA